MGGSVLGWYKVGLVGGGGGKLMLLWELRRGFWWSCANNVL